MVDVYITVTKKAHMTALFILIVLLCTQWQVYGQSTAKSSVSAGLAVFELTLVDGDATMYATFQSHNQKVVQNDNGIFITHIRTRNDAYTAQQWRLSRSVDGGKTFTVVYEDTDATNPPVLETDENNVVYLIRPDFIDGNAYLYRFSPDDDYAEPVISTIPGGSAGKYAMCYDRERKKLYYSPWGHTFYAIGLDGTVSSKLLMFRNGPNAAPQYPVFCMGGDSTIHMGYTTVKHGEYLYWSAHHLESPDGGNSWQTMGGTSITGFPVNVDDTGPSDLISLDTELNAHTWLSSMLAKDEKMHFMYDAQSPFNTEHYMRYNDGTGQREIDADFEEAGQTIGLKGLSGYFAADPSTPGSTLYSIGWSSGRVGCLASDDNGETWYDYALTTSTFHGYSLGGCREITADGYILGYFTDVGTDPARVIFFKIRAGLSTASVELVEYNAGNLTIRFKDWRGNPEKVRFSADGETWSEWHDFSEEVSADLDSPPLFFQLLSTLGVESKPLYALTDSPESWEMITAADCLPGNEVYAIIEASDGAIWFGTRNEGVARYDGVSWSTYSYDDGLASDYVYTLCESGDGSMWFGTYGAGVSKYDGSTWTNYTTADGIGNDKVVSAGADDNGNLWFGTRNGGLSHYDGSSWTTYTIEDGLAGNWVRAIAKAHDGTMWFGTNIGGISCYDGENFIPATHEDELLNKSIYAIAAANDGTVWVSCYGLGAARWDGSSWTTFTVADGLASGYITTIAVADDGSAWFGTEDAGVMRYKNEEWSTFTTGNRLPGNSVKSIVIDRENAVWIGTKSGVARYSAAMPLTVCETSVSPVPFAITGNSPNPFNAGTMIEFMLLADTDTQLDVFSITGQKVVTLISGFRLPGHYRAFWNGRSSNGSIVSSGQYFAVLKTDTGVTQHRMMLVK